jgi:hypothetical protein
LPRRLHSVARPCTYRPPSPLLAPAPACSNSTSRHPTACQLPPAALAGHR